MLEPGSVRVRAVTGGDLGRVGAFLHANLNGRVTAEAWSRAFVPPWPVEAPNHGFLLEDGDEVVGVYAAIYSERCIDGRPEPFCNLAAWCVLESHRAHGIRLLRALLAQRGYHFTDLSPSGNVVPLNERLRFESLDTTTALVPNLPAGPTRRRARLVTDLGEIARHLRDDELRLFQDHRDAPAAQHLLLVAGDEHSYVVTRRDRRKGLPLFATIIHVGDKAVFRRHAGLVFAHLLRHGALATLAEERVVGFAPRLSWRLRNPRPRMFRSRTLGAEHIDYMYSELACVAW